MKPDYKANEYAGYHKFGSGDSSFGSFEVFWHDGSSDTDPDAADQPAEAGWYWWACFPGCLPDGEPIGPFETSYEAWKDAQDLN